MRFSCLTSQFVWVVLVNVFQWNREWFEVWLGVQRDGGTWSFPTWTRSRLLLHRHLEMSREVVEETLLILQESPRDPLLELVDAVSKWMFSVPYLLQGFDSSVCDWKNKFSLSVKYHLFRIESFRVDFRCVHRLQLLTRSATSTSPFQIPPAYNVYPRNNPGKTFFPIWMDSGLVLRIWRVTLNQWTKWNNRSFEWLPKTSFIGRLPIR